MHPWLAFISLHDVNQLGLNKGLKVIALHAPYKH